MLFLKRQPRSNSIALACTATTLWLLLLALAAPGLAQEGTTGATGDMEAFRSQMVEMMEGLEAAPGMNAAKVTAARARIESASDQDLILLKAQLGKLPHWQRLPAILLSASTTEIVQARQVFNSASLPRSVQSPELFQAQFLTLIDRFSEIAALTGDEALIERAARIRTRVLEFPQAELPRLQEMFQRAAPRWKAELIMGNQDGVARAALGDQGSDKLVFGSCDRNCSWADIPCWVSELECDTSTLVSEIASYATAIADIGVAIANFFVDVVNQAASLVSQVGNFFTGLWDTIKSGFEYLLDQLMDQIPTTPEEALALIGLNNINWVDFWNTFRSGAAQLNLTCDTFGLGMGAQINGFGEIGSARAEFVCKRGLLWLEEKVGEVLGQVIGEDGDGDGEGDDLRYQDPTAPISGAAMTTDKRLFEPVGLDRTAAYDPTRATVERTANKIGLGAVYKIIVTAPIKFYCGCFVNGSAMSFDQAQAAHRLEALNTLDADFDTRAREVNLQATLADSGSLPGQVSAAQTDVDESHARRADLRNGVAGQGGVLGSDGMDDQANQLTALQDAQADALTDFQILEKRLDLEAALRDSPASAPPAAFQLPMALGGNLEEVAELVLETINRTEAAGLEVFDARVLHRKGDSLFLEGAWEKALASYQDAYLTAVGELP